MKTDVQYYFSQSRFGYTTAANDLVQKACTDPGTLIAA